jgi:hypothetical protein
MTVRQPSGAAGAAARRGPHRHAALNPMSVTRVLTPRCHGGITPREFASAPSRRPSDEMPRSLTFLCVVLVGLSGCAGGRPEPPFNVTDELAPVLSPGPTLMPTRTPAPTVSSRLGENELAVGDTASIARDAQAWAELTLTEVRVDRSYRDPGPGIGGDAPRAGYDFVAANVTLTAVGDAVGFELSDFRASVDAEGRIEQVFSYLGPKPDLLPGSLEAGQSASGWLIYEAPEVGRVRLSYDDGSATMAPTEFLLRAE